MTRETDVKKTPRPLLIGILGALLAACATTPPRNERLEQARMEVRSLEQDPAAERVAGEQLAAARTALRSADTASQKHESLEEVNYLAYIAQRQAQIGKARIDEAHAREQVAQASAERDRILLQARTAEARQAQAQAQQAQALAQQAQASAQDQAAQAVAARAEAQSAQNQLQQEQAKAQQALADLRAHQTQRGLELTLGSDVLFDSGSATLKPGAALQLNRLGAFMHENPGTRIIVEGYTDSQGPAAYNQALSERRSQAVADALAAQGVDRDRIQTVGRGQDYPVASNATSAGRQQNRRVDIILSNVSGQFAEGARQGPVLR